MRLAYWIISGLTFLSALACFILPSPKPPAETITETSEEQEIKETNKSGDFVTRSIRSLKNLLFDRNFWTVTFVGIFLCVYVGAEVCYGGWLYTFAVDMKWATRQGADYATALYWASFTFGRILAIPISTKISSTILLVVDIIGAVGSMTVLGLVQIFTMMTVGTDSENYTGLGPITMYICTIVLGLSLASAYPRSESSPSCPDNQAS